MPKGPKGQRRPADMNQLAKSIVDIPRVKLRRMSRSAGRPGGLKGGEARAEKLTPEQRQESARKAAVALHFMHYNFVRIHQTLRVTPAMAAGVTDRLWSVEDIATLLD